MQYRISLESFCVKSINQLIQKLKWFLESKTTINSKSVAFWNIKVIPLPTQIVKHTLNRSPHINKTAREQFETRIYKRLICIETNINLTKLSALKVLFSLQKLLIQKSYTKFIRSKINISI
jgi:ribosomal protein S10